MVTVERAVADFNTRAKANGWSQYCDPSNAFVLRDCDELVALWMDARGEKELPFREDFSIRVLKPYLARLAMVERVAENPPQYKFRVVGTIVTQTLAERTGQNFDHESATPEQTQRWTHSANLALTARRPLRFPICTQSAIIGEMLALPLADHAGEARYVLAYGRYEPTRDWTVREERIQAAE